MSLRRLIVLGADFLFKQLGGEPIELVNQSAPADGSVPAGSIAVWADATTKKLASKDESNVVTNYGSGGGSSDLVYLALVSQSGSGDPSVTVLKNTLGGTVTPSRFAQGFYRFTLTGAFLSGKTAARCTPSYTAVASDQWFDYGASRLNDNAVQVTTVDRGGSGNAADNCLISALLEIVVVP